VTAWPEGAARTVSVAARLASRAAASRDRAGAVEPFVRAVIRARYQC